MKQSILFFIVAFLPCLLQAQIQVSGTVTDAYGPLPRANVFIEGTIDGCLSDSLGLFSFQTQKRDSLVLHISYIGYEDCVMLLDQEHCSDLQIRLRTAATSIDEVTITASSFTFGKVGNMKQLDALDIVMAGNSCGDVVAALQSLPGTQKVGEDGKLYVRGGDQTECQTFINGMHVLEPYSTNAENSAVRGRFSPFLFKGINFSLGGYEGEYGQALSSVLPMETTDVTACDKLGMSASLLDWNLGGTKSFRSSSLSFNAAYTDLSFYEKMFPSRIDWIQPNRNLSGEVQYKKEFNPETLWKTYVGYDYTWFKLHAEERPFALRNGNLYANSVFRTTLGSGYRLMAGMAYSLINDDIRHVQCLNDHYHNRREEWHLKAEMRKTITSALKVSAGIESYLRFSDKDYRFLNQDSAYTLDYNLVSAHADAQLRFLRHLFLSTSLRAEHLSCDNRWTWMPRATLSYVPNARFQISASLGRFSQTAQDDYIALSQKTLQQTLSDHAILSLVYRQGRQLFRIEPYVKRYRRLPYLNDGIWKSTGYGDSRGIDFYNEGTFLKGRLVTTLAYSYCDAERLYLDYTELSVPRYSTRHNLNLTAKYYISPLKAYLGLAESYASGRPYHDPNKPGYMNANAKAYNSLSVNMTFLVHPKVIVYTSFSNVLGRKNIYGYNYSADGTVRTPIRSSSDQFFYIGVFISLKSNKAYDIANF